MRVVSGRDCAAAVSATLAFKASAVMQPAANRMMPVRAIRNGLLQTVLRVVVMRRLLPNLVPHVAERHGRAGPGTPPHASNPSRVQREKESGDQQHEEKPT
jgi:hypothetical protein